MFYEEEKKPSYFILSIGCFILKVLKLVLSYLSLVDFAIKPIQSVISAKQPTVFLNCLKKILLSWLNML